MAWGLTVLQCGMVIRWMRVCRQGISIEACEEPSSSRPDGRSYGAGIMGTMQVTERRGYDMAMEG